MDNVYSLAIGANISFAIGSLIYADYAKRFHARWMNFFKAVVAVIAFGLFFLYSFDFDFFNTKQFLGLFLSGFIGLGLGDIFLLYAFAHFGAGRTLMVFGFQPVLLGVMSYFFFGQEVTLTQIFSIFLFIGCLLTISHEHYRVNRKWEFIGLLAAIAGVFLDGAGVVLTRYAFDLEPRLTSMEGNFYRCLGAVASFIFVKMKYDIDFMKFNRMLDRKQWVVVIIGSLLGTFVSLGFYLKAVQTGHLASISGIAITGSLFSSMVECVVEKKWPSLHLVFAFSLFLVGAFFLF